MPSRTKDPDKRTIRRRAEKIRAGWSARQCLIRAGRTPEAADAIVAGSSWLTPLIRTSELLPAARAIAESSDE